MSTELEDLKQFNTEKAAALDRCHATIEQLQAEKSRAMETIIRQSAEIEELKAKLAASERDRKNACAAAAEFEDKWLASERANAEMREVLNIIGSEKPDRATGGSEMSPSQCETLTDILSMQRTYKESRHYSMLIQHDGAVILTEQKIGESSKAKITIPHRDFKKLIAWYHEDQSALQEAK